MKKILYAIVCLFTIIAIVGCGNQNNGGKKTINSYSVVDGRGKTIVFDKKPSRIATLHYSTDEILLDLVDASRIAALSKSAHEPALCNIPDRANVIKTIAQDNAEFMISNKVDLVFIRENYRKETIEGLENANIKVFVTSNPVDIEGVAKFVKQMAAAVGEKEKGDQLVSAMRSEIKKVAEKYKVPSDKQYRAMVFGKLGASSLKGSIVDEIFKYAQIKNATADVELDLPKQAKARLSKEQIVKANPDLILLIDYNYQDIKNGDDKFKSEVINDPALSTVKAIKNKNIVLVPMRSTICFSHYIAKNIVNIADAVYGKK
ncbi:MAG: ABC transporter substrate-binding protein [Phascolarctobacterium sp.]|nr:ABC transporter substrate-binding protein [Phascolarctobacterium sp.]